MGYFLLLLTNLAFPFAALGVFFGFLFSPRRRVLKTLGQELKERFALQSPEDIPQNAVWIHCASVGEVMSVAGLVKELKAYYGKDVIFTTSTTAGKETALKNTDIQKAFLAPMDCYPIVRNFVRKANPHRFFIVERDLWPNTVVAAVNNGVPAAIVNGRISKKSTKSYALVKPLFKLVLNKLSFAALQTPAAAKRYELLGLAKNKIYVCGNVKYDTLNEHPTKLKQVNELIEKLGWQNKKIFVCGSTHPLEEDLIISAVPAFSEQDIKVIFAPRHLERVKEIENKLDESGLAYGLISQGKYPENCAIVCADAMGLLQSLYTCASLTFVGGSIAPRGAHNLLEPAILGKTVLFGQSFQNTPDTAHALLLQGGAVLVNPDNFKDTVLRLLKDSALLENMSANARKTALSFKGATNKIMEVVNTYERKTT